MNVMGGGGGGGGAVLYAYELTEKNVMSDLT